MQDPRIKKMAQVLVQYCCKIKKGQFVEIVAGIPAVPLVKEVYVAILKAGAHPFSRIVVEDLEELFYRHANNEQLQFVSPINRYSIEKIDAMIALRSPLNTKNLSGSDPKKQALSRKANHVIMDRFSKRAAAKQLAWVVTNYPTEAAAQDAGMSLSEYEDFVYRACMIDQKDPIAAWQKMSKYNQRLIDYLKRKKTIRLAAPDTDLTFKVGGRKWINCSGEYNFPDGEVFTAPIEDSMSGKIRFTFPAVYSGREVDDVRLEFGKGKVIKATAAKGQDFLHAMIDMDKGARYVGEVAIGTNFGIQQFTRSILYDEKIGGTYHMALGNSYPESGGKNRSALHWDMICDLRKKGAMYADGELFFKNGKFVK